MLTRVHCEACAIYAAGIGGIWLCQYWWGTWQQSQFYGGIARSRLCCPARLTLKGFSDRYHSLPAVLVTPAFISRDRAWGELRGSYCAFPAYSGGLHVFRREEEEISLHAPFRELRSHSSRIATHMGCTASKVSEKVPSVSAHAMQLLTMQLDFGLNRLICSQCKCQISCRS